MYSFARQPKWIVAHVLVAVLLTVFVLAGLWQLSRHRWRTDLNHAVSSQAELPIVDLFQLDLDDPDGVEYRIATVAGSFAPGEILIRSRSLDGSPGCHVLAILETGNNAGLVVNRGWLPLAECERGEAAGPATIVPTGRLELTGRVRTTETRGRFGAIDPSDGELTVMARVDVARIDEQSPLDLVPIYLDQIEPAEPDLPVELPEPATDAGPHLGYMVQWFSFAAVAIVGYPLVLRRQARPSE